MSSTEPEQLLPSRSFSVSSAMLGSKTAFEWNPPKTLEDMLTLLHQNSLSCINILNQQSLDFEQIELSFLPQAIKDAMRRIEKTDWGRGVQRLGVEVNKKEMILRYNVPLRNHSGHLDLHYDISTGKTVLKAQLLGAGAWNGVANWISMLEEAGVYIQERPFVHTEQELTFYREVSSDSGLFDALKDYADMAEYSLDCSEDNCLNPFERFKDQPESIEKIAEMCFGRMDPRWGRFYGQYIATGVNLQRAIDAAKTGLESGDEIAISGALTLLLARVAQKQGFEAAIEAAQATIGNRKPLVRSAALKLFRELVWQGQGVDAAIKAAQATVGKDDNIQLERLLLLEALVKQRGRGYKEAIEAAQTNIASNNGDLAYQASVLFQELFNREQGFEEAIEAAKTIIDSKQSRALELFNRLVMGGHGISAAIEATKTTVKSDNENVRIKTLQLLAALVRQGQHFEAAIEVAKTTIEDKDRAIRVNALFLFGALVKQGQDYGEAIKAAKTCLRSEDRFLQGLALDLFEELVKRRQGLKEAREAGITASISTDKYVAKQANELLGLIPEYTSND